MCTRFILLPYNDGREQDGRKLNIKLTKGVGCNQPCSGIHKSSQLRSDVESVEEASWEKTWQQRGRRDSPAPSGGTCTTGESGTYTRWPCTAAPCSCRFTPHRTASTYTRKRQHKTRHVRDEHSHRFGIRVIKVKALLATGRRRRQKTRVYQRRGNAHTHVHARWGGGGG